MISQTMPHDVDWMWTNRFESNLIRWCNSEFKHLGFGELWKWCCEQHTIETGCKAIPKNREG
jgi:hypothetical protein